MDRLKMTRRCCTTQVRSPGFSRNRPTCWLNAKPTVQAAEPQGARSGFRNVSAFPLLPLLTIILLLLTGCQTNQDNESRITVDQKSNRIVTVSYALQYLTQRIVGDEFEVEFPASDSLNPRNWSPSVEEIGAMQKADLVIANGPGAVYADWLERVTLDESRICHSCSEFEIKDYISVNDHQIVHSHGPEGEHSHPYFVPYAWLDPSIAIKQARTIAAAVINTYPDKSDLIEQNLEALVADLQELKEQFAAAAKPNSKVLTLNPQMKFLTRAIELEDDHLLFFANSGEAPDWDELRKQLADKNNAQPDQEILVDGSVTAELKQIATELRLRVVEIDLLERTPQTGDFLSTMKENLSRLSD